MFLAMKDVSGNNGHRHGAQVHGNLKTSLANGHMMTNGSSWLSNSFHFLSIKVGKERGTKGYSVPADRTHAALRNGGIVEGLKQPKQTASGPS